MLASRELGYLRDPAFVLPTQSSSFEVRLATIACLAFLWSDEGTSRLKDAALHDHEPGVRQSALWAYAFRRRSRRSEPFYKSSERRSEPSSARVCPPDFEDGFLVASLGLFV